MALTPFDVEKYRNHQPVITRDGRTIENLKEQYYPEIDTTFLTAVVDLLPVVWDINGKMDYRYGTESGLDLFMGELITYYWVESATLLDADPHDSDYSKVFVVEVSS